MTWQLSGTASLLESCASPKKEWALRAPTATHHKTGQVHTTKTQRTNMITANEPARRRYVC